MARPTRAASAAARLAEHFGRHPFTYRDLCDAGLDVHPMMLSSARAEGHLEIVGDDGQPRMRSSANAHAPTRWRVSSQVAARLEEAV